MDTSWTQGRRTAVFLAAAGLPLLWCAIASQFRDDFTSATDALVLVVIVVGIAATGDRMAGAVAAVSGGAWFDYFLTAPFNHFTIDDANDVEVTVLLVAVGIAVTEIVLWGRRQQARASKRAGYLDGILSTSQIVAGGLSSVELTDEVATHLTDLLGVDVVRFVPGSSIPADRPVLGADGEVTVHGTQLNVARDGLPTLDETSLAAQHHGVVHGQLLITASTDVVRPTLEQRQVAVLLSNQVGAAYATSPHGVGRGGSRRSDSPTVMR
jgi:K+-sensing histidine kinase KdpD